MDARMKLAVIGSRNFTDYDLMERCLLRNFRVEEIDAVISGGARGADALAASGFAATTLMGGAHTRIEKTDLSPLKGKDIILWPDNDEPGRKYADNVAEALLKLPVASLKITPPTPDKPTKWDAADAVASSGDR